jgi:hypothetical protein
MEIVQWFITNWEAIAQTIAYIIAGVSIIVKLTPTLSDDNILLGVIKFLSKYIALNTPTPEKRPE